MLRRVALAACVTSLVLGLVAPAAASPPTIQRDINVTNTVQDNGENCGFPVRWDIDLTLDITTFFDEDGNVVRQHFQVREMNTITNVDSGLTLVEGPDSFIQRNIFNDDGTVTIEANGLSVNVQSEDKLKDVGRFVTRVGPGLFEVVLSAGPHPVRGLATSGSIGPELLAAFCEVLS